MSSQHNEQWSYVDSAGNQQVVWGPAGLTAAQVIANLQTYGIKGVTNVTCVKRWETKFELLQPKQITKL